MKAALAQLLPGRFDTFCVFAFVFVYLYFCFFVFCICTALAWEVWYFLCICICICVFVLSLFCFLYLHSSCLGGLILVSCICSPFHMFPFSLSLSSIWRSGTTIDFRFLHFLLPLNFTHLPLIWYFFTILTLEPTTQWTCCKMSTIRQDKYFHKLFCIKVFIWHLGWRLDKYNLLQETFTFWTQMSEGVASPEEIRQFFTKRKYRCPSTFPQIVGSY